MEAQAIKDAASATIDNYKEELKELGSKIWEEPELGYEEHTAHQLLTDFLVLRWSVATLAWRQLSEPLLAVGVPLTSTCVRYANMMPCQK